MSILVTINKEQKRLLITYLSKSVFLEAVLKVLSEKNSEFEILKELDRAFQSDGILKAGCQGKLVARLLLLSAWCHLICHKRNKMKVCINFFE